jgi:hypothetical protein
MAESMMRAGLLSETRKSALRQQWLVYAGLCSITLGLAAGTRFVDRQLFQRFVGTTDPVIVVTGASVLGAVLLKRLLREGFLLVRDDPGRGLRAAAGLASIFGLAIIAMDFAIVHPADLNVPFPRSLLFYPVVAFVVEIVFHVFPFALFLTLVRVRTGASPRGTAVWMSGVLVAFLEPSLQVGAVISGRPLVGTPHHYAAWALAYDGVQVLAINLCQLWIFRRYDFVSMYTLRLVYYVVWHIVWGQVRVGIFAS